MIVPNQFELRDPVLYRAQREVIQPGRAPAFPPAGVGQPRVADTAALFMGDQAGAFEDEQVFADRRQGNRVRFGQLTERSFAPGQPVQHGAPDGVGQSRKSDVQRTACILNHVVQYPETRFCVKSVIVENYFLRF